MTLEWYKKKNDNNGTRNAEKFAVTLYLSYIRMQLCVCVCDMRESVETQH